MPAGLGAGGAVGVALETGAAPGTWVTPAAWVPVTAESMVYTEDRYYSEAIRQLTITPSSKQGYYHIEGDISLEADSSLLPYFLHASRLGVTKTGASAPFTYRYTPTSGATIPATNRTLSISVERNNVWFGYAGCVVTSVEFTIDTGVLRANFHVIGLSDIPAATVGTPTPTFATTKLLGADAHSIAVGDGALTSAPSGAAAMTGTTVDQTFDGFTFTANENGAAQNRINQSRAAAYISMGITEAQVTSSLDFQSRAEYDKFVSNANKRLQLISSNGLNDKVVVNVYNSVYEAYNVDLGAWGDLIMADSTFHILASGGTNPPFDINVVSTLDLAVT